MAPRPLWKGYLKLALVTCPVALFTAASTAERISFHTYNRETGHRVRRQFIDAETGEVVDQDEQVRGYDLKGEGFVEIEDEEYDAVALESTHTIDIDKFVPRSQVDEIYVDAPYYLIPTDEVGEEAFAVIREAMRSRKMAGVARLVLYRRERIVLLEPRDKGMLLTTLHYANEVRPQEDYFDEIPDTRLSKEMLDLAGHIIDTKMSRFDPRQFKDRYEEALKALVQAKAKGKKIPTPPARKPPNVVSLMDALRQSLGTSNDNEGEGSEDEAPAKPARKNRSTKAGSAAGTKRKSAAKPRRKAS
ncbi:MAG TPA: Ku protein [Geminicoccus sp.]|uniref:non-homologous end joining protein Ku n=1 Tax=Geminicoccus sp. TaxID=2024832 RepID=UPI002C029230|nr:Ku protein [Geminicoccus sp.]HWL66864.1 Ku protein [Geminicoccus sp.]